MTLQEYEKKRDEILDGIPKEFAAFLSMKAWEYGHSAGFEEVINYLQGLEYDFRNAYNRWLNNK